MGSSLALLRSSVIQAQARCIVRTDGADAGVVGAQARCIVRTDDADAGVVGAQSDFSVNLVDPGARHHSSSGRPRPDSVGASNTGSLNLAGGMRHGSIPSHNALGKRCATVMSVTLDRSVGSIVPAGSPLWLSGIVLAAPQ